MIDDETLINQVNAHIRANPYASRVELKRKFGVGEQRFIRLHKEGKIKYPHPMNRSMAATLNRKRNKVMAGWTIKSNARRVDGVFMQTSLTEEK